MQITFSQPSLTIFIKGANNSDHDCMSGWPWKDCSEYLLVIDLFASL